MTPVIQMTCAYSGAMASSALPDLDLQRRREAVVAEHMRAEMAADLDATLATFPGEPEYDIVPLHGVRRGHDEVRELLAHLLGAFPDLGLHVVVLRHTVDAVIIEGRMTGTQRGVYAGCAASGRVLDLRAAIFFHFDDDRLRRETVYYDELTLLTQIAAMP